jgi:hypothetical protein
VNVRNGGEIGQVGPILVHRDLILSGVEDHGALPVPDEALGGFSAEPLREAWKQL